MNISLPKNTLVALAMLLSVPILAQRDTTLTIAMGETAELDFRHYKKIRYGLGVTLFPNDGFITLPTILFDDIYRITYQPRAGFHGTDNFSFTYMTCTSPRHCLETYNVTVKVLKNSVRAENDLNYTTVNSGPIEIDAVANDQSSNGVLDLVSIPMTNNGQAEIDHSRNVILFTPDTDFEGIANFNYTVCDGTGVCDRATVNVAVNDPSANQRDTIQVFTSKNESVPIFVSPLYDLINDPAHGSFSRQTQVPYYYPEDDFLGTDYLEFQHQTNIKVVEVTVLDIQRNQFALDDKANVSPGDFVEIDVLANDLFGYESCFQSIGQPRYGSITTDPEAPGFISYQAPDGFVGIDEFTYTIRDPNCGEEPETATVSVYVSNYEPAYSKFFMSTPKKTPLVIGYNVPISDFSFDIKAQGDLGEVIFLEGQKDTVIYGQQISGYNLILYIPDESVNEGVDQFELSFCNTSTNDGTCKLRKDIKVEIDILDIGGGIEPMCFDDCIWAGDTNFDGIVNMEDLLPIGLHMGRVGEGRAERDLNLWYGQYGDDWNIDFEANVEANIKHVDTNGDSVITSLDTVAINKWYGNTHSMTAAKIPAYDFQIRLEGDVLARPGDMVELDMVVGSEDAPATDLYGFTFSIPYSTQFFDPGSATIGFANNSWIKYNSPALTMTRNITRGLLESGFTRTNGTPISGFGKVGVLRLVISDDISGIKDEDGKIEVELGGISTATATLGNGQNVGVVVAPHTVTIDLGTAAGSPDAETPSTRIDLDQRLKSFPNPANNRLQLHLNGGERILGFEMFSLTGQRVKYGERIDARRTSIDLGDLENGMYALRVITPSGTTSRMIEVMH
jgi:hypothetical protein